MATGIVLADDGYEDVMQDPRKRVMQKLRTTWIAIGLLVFGFGGAMTLVPIGGAVIGAGQVGVESRVKRVAHPTGGIIAGIFVKNGTHVVKGQPLMQFDDTVTGTDAELSSLSVYQLMAQRARLEAERLGTAAIAFPPELLSSEDPGARKAMADEQKLFAIRASERTGIASQLAARVTQYQQQIRGYRAQIGSLREQQELIKPEQDGVRDLWRKDLVTINRLNQLERTSSELSGSIASLEAQIAQTEARITEAREQMLQMHETRRSDAGTQLAAVNGTLNQQQVRSVTAGDAKDRSLIRAPYSGVVDKMAFATIGDVVRPAETIMEIVPDTDKLLVEAMISPADIDQVAQGQRARIRFSAFSMTATPEVEGRVVFVAPERTTDNEGQRSYYAVRIAIDETGLKALGGLALKPGMPAEIYIQSGSRSMLSYITKPLRDQFARAFRDN